MTYNRISPFGVQHDLVSPGEEFRAQNERSAMQHHLQQLAMNAQMDALRGSGGSAITGGPPTAEIGGADIANNGDGTPHNYFGPAHETRNFDLALQAQKDMSDSTLKNRLDVAGLQMGPAKEREQLERDRFSREQPHVDFQNQMEGEKMRAIQGMMGAAGNVPGDKNESQRRYLMLNGQNPGAIDLQDMQMAELKAQAEDRTRARSKEEAERLRAGEAYNKDTGQTTLPDSSTPEALNAIIGQDVPDFINADTAWLTKDPGIEQQNHLVELFHQLVGAYARKNGGNMQLAKDQALADFKGFGKKSGQGSDYLTDNWGQQTRALYSRLH